MELYAEPGELSQAIAEFQAAVHSDATSVSAHYNLALAYGTRGDLAAMQRELPETLRLDPKHAHAHSALAALYLERQQYDLAWEPAQQAAHLGDPVQPLVEVLRRKQERIC